MKINVLKYVVGFGVLLATGLIFASASLPESKATYESLLSKIREGYFAGSEVGVQYAEIIEKNFGLDGLERLYRDTEKDARFDQRTELFRDVWLHNRIEELKKARAAVIPLYELLLSKIREGYLNGNDVGPEYAEIIEKNFGLDGLEWLYRDTKKDARFDQRTGLFRDGWLRNRIEELKKTRVAVIPSEKRTADVSEKARATINQLEEKMKRLNGIELKASEEFKQALIDAINKSGLAVAFLEGWDIFLVRLELAKHTGPYMVEMGLLSTFPTEHNESLLKESARLYKIHFMPLDSNFKDVVLRLISEIKNNKDLAGSMHSIKVKPLLDQDIQKIGAEGILPKIVIYISGKELAQKALNILYDAFKNEKGSGHCPPFNEKVTDLIYYTQGNRNEKLAFPQYYEQPDMVYFFPTVTGNREDYHLINPARKK
jgi:transcriptional regulator